MIRYPPDQVIISIVYLFGGVDAAVATVHLMICGCGGCWSVGDVCAWDAWLLATARLAAGVFVVAVDLLFQVAPR